MARFGRIIALLLVVFATSGLLACDQGGLLSRVSSAVRPADQASTPLTPYVALYPSFSSDAAEGPLSARIDCSSVASGYVAASAQSDSGLKFQVVFGDTTYSYDLPGDGTPYYFPLQSGNGYYGFRIMQDVGDNRYIELFSTGAQVEMESELAPFLRPNRIVEYSASSECVAVATEMRANASSELDLAASIYDYITENVEYDYEKAAGVSTGYIPSPDETLATKRGICFDYASLAAAMMRSQGIPAKVVTGYVLPDNIYHAWNVLYFEETGWITVEIAVEEGTWRRVDLTFAAIEANDDPEVTLEYVDRYVY
ncbi:MAG: transglutaminase domain-containing protein [Actinobacteria bacterium]|nr:transglutaminase domain-containing protein [Actinomycetota bacterium]